MVNGWFGLVVWIPGIPLWKGLLLRGAPRIPNHQSKPPINYLVMWPSNSRKIIQEILSPFRGRHFLGAFCPFSGSWQSSQHLGQTRMTKRVFCLCFLLRQNNENIVKLHTFWCWFVGAFMMICGCFDVDCSCCDIDWCFWDSKYGRILLKKVVFENIRIPNQGTSGFKFVFADLSVVFLSGALVPPRWCSPVWEHLCIAYHSFLTETNYAQTYLNNTDNEMIISPDLIQMCLVYTASCLTWQCQILLCFSLLHVFCWKILSSYPTIWRSWDYPCALRRERSTSGRTAIGSRWKREPIGD